MVYVALNDKNIVCNLFFRGLLSKIGLALDEACTLYTWCNFRSYGVEGYETSCNDLTIQILASDNIINFVTTNKDTQR